MRAGIVLAGGASRRMGRDKALLEWQGAPLAAHVCRVLAPVVDRVIVVAAHPVGVAIPGAETVGDRWPGEGPLGGIITGLEAAGEGVHFVCACDMPLLRAELVRLILDRADGLDAAVPRAGGREHPLCAAYASSCMPPLTAAFLAGERSVRRALGALRVRWIVEAELAAADPTLESLRGANTREELAALQRRTEEPWRS